MTIYTEYLNTPFSDSVRLHYKIIKGKIFQSQTYSVSHSNLVGLTHSTWLSDNGSSRNQLTNNGSNRSKLSLSTCMTIGSFVDFRPATILYKCETSREVAVLDVPYVQSVDLQRLGVTTPHRFEFAQQNPTFTSTNLSIVDSRVFRLLTNTRLKYNRS